MASAPTSKASVMAARLAEMGLRRAILGGMDPQEAYLKYGKF